MTMRSPIRKYALALLTCMTVLSLRAPAQGANPPPGLVGTWAGPGGAPFQFNGTGTFEVPYSPGLDLPNGTSWTLSAWVLRQSDSMPQHIAGKRGICAGGAGFYQIAIDHNAPNQGMGIDPQYVPLNVWTNVAIAMNGNSGWIVYANGYPVKTVYAPGWTIQNGAPFRIGGAGTCAPFIGMINGVQLYARALRQGEILATLSAGPPGAATAGVVPAYQDSTTQEAPPPIPAEDVPPCPEPDYIWNPGYWSWGPSGYFWVPGTWVPAPAVGLLWTPGYWAFVNGAYVFNAGYWGTTVGFYGGINYGGGYGGDGFVGGHWEGGHVSYNTAVVAVNTNMIHHTYADASVASRGGGMSAQRVSYSGGPGGARSTQTARERAAALQPHVHPTPLQAQHAREARANPQLLKSNSHGSPALARPAAMRPTIGARPTAPTAQAPRAPAGHGAGPAPAAAQSHPPQPTHPAQPAHPVAGAPSQNKPQPHPTPPPQKPHRS
jgi:hypothetical protein